MVDKHLVILDFYVDLIVQISLDDCIYEGFKREERKEVEDYIAFETLEVVYKIVFNGKEHDDYLEQDYWDICIVMDH